MDNVDSNYPLFRSFRHGFGIIPHHEAADTSGIGGKGQFSVFRILVADHKGNIVPYIRVLFRRQFRASIYKGIRHLSVPEGRCAKLLVVGVLKYDLHVYTGVQPSTCVVPRGQPPLGSAFLDLDGQRTCRLVIVLLIEFVALSDCTGVIHSKIFIQYRVLIPIL